MTRYTTFKFCLDPGVEQRELLARHAGASRFAFNQCLHMVKEALNQRKSEPNTHVPWTGFDLINAFNAWKVTDDAGRVFAVDGKGEAKIVVTGLRWRGDVYQQVFEEAAIDLSRSLKAWSDCRSGKRRGKHAGFPRFKRKTVAVTSFRFRNKQPEGRPPTIRVGEGDRPRSITVPKIGRIAVHDDTRRLRRMLTAGRAKILFATVSHHAGRWWASLNVEAADLHPAQRHPVRDPGDGNGWVGVDLGLSAFVVAAASDGSELARITAPRPLAKGMERQRRLAKSLSRKQKGSINRRDAAAKLGRHHHHVANVRRHFLHQTSNTLVKTHDRLVIEGLNITGMLTNHRLARAISDAGWKEFARMLRYKQDWRGGELLVADRWFPSSRLCRVCGAVNRHLSLASRVFTCDCGHLADRDTNAAANLARLGEIQHNADPRTPKQRGRATNARRRDGSDQHPTSAGETSPNDAGTEVHNAPAA